MHERTFTPIIISNPGNEEEPDTRILTRKDVFGSLLVVSALLCMETHKTRTSSLSVIKLSYIFRSESSQWLKMSTKTSDEAYTYVSDIARL